MGQIRAEGLQHAADAQARAQANSAQIWGGALQSLGQIPGEVAKYKLADAETKQRQQETDQRARYIQGEKDANWIYQGLMKPDANGVVNIDETTLPKLQAGMANAGVPLEIQDRAINSLKSINQSNQEFRQQQMAHQVRVAQNVMSSVTPDHPLTPGTALATLKMMQVNGGANAHDVDTFMAAVNQGHDPADIFKAIIQNGAQPAKPITNAFEAGQAAGMTPQAIFDRVHPPQASGAAQKPFTNEIELRQDAATQGTTAETPTAWQSVETLRQIDEAKAKAPAAQKSLQRESVLLDGKRAIVQVDPDPSATVKVFDLDGKPIPNAAERVKPIPPQAPAGGSPTDVTNAAEIADAIIRGDQPPELTGLYRMAGPVRAELARKGYNQTAALTDWRATQKHIATLNGPQQLKLNQSINALPELLDSVDALADQWKAGRFPLLNKANLALAKGGAYGKDAAAIANSLSTQIADVRADLASVYMGGNSPTDQAFQLAKTSLDEDWDQSVLKKMTALARSNVQIRQNSIRNTGVAGASQNNPYASQVPAAAPPAAPSAVPSYQDYLKAKQGKK
jgi:hypothetical protein